jgi:glycosyltransferase involved in cell wall biosynthesis
MCHHVANALVKFGHDVYVLSPGDSNSAHEKKYNLLSDRCDAPWVLDGSPWERLELPRLRAFLHNCQSNHQFDQFVAMHPHYYGHAMLTMDSSKRPPLSVLFHGFELRSQIMLRSRLQALGSGVLGVERSSIRNQTIQLLRHADVVFANSMFTKHLIGRVRKNNKTAVIGCGVESDIFFQLTNKVPKFARLSKGEVRRKLGLNPNKRLVGYMGRLVRSKNVDTILRVIKLDDSLNAVIVGSGVDLDRLQQLTASLNLTHRVHFAGTVSEQEKWPLLQAMDVLCLLSQNGARGEMEGFGIVALEANAAGTPVIVSNQGGLPGTILDNSTGIVAENLQPNTILEDIRRLTDDDQLSARFVAAARARIANSQTWEHVAQRMLSAWSIE